MSSVTLTNNEKRFSEAFKLFRQVSDQELRMKRWITEDLSEIINSHQFKVDDDVMNFLGIGSGFGQMDMLLFDVIGNKNQKINELVLEPNKVAIEQFKSTILSSDEYSYVKLECIPESIESYMMRKSSRKFHFIHCIHVLYYVKDPIATIEAACNSLIEGGIFFIVHSAESHAIAHVKNKFGKKLFPKPPKYIPNGNELEQIVKDRGYRYFSDTINASVDVTECMDSCSYNGNLLWDFITNVDHFNERTSQELKDAIYDTIISDFCYKDNGKVYLKVDCSVLIVVK